MCEARRGGMQVSQKIQPLNSLLRGLNKAQIWQKFHWMTRLGDIDGGYIFLGKSI